MAETEEKQEYCSKCRHCRDAEIARRWHAGETQDRIGEAMGISQSTVSRALLEAGLVQSRAAQRQRSAPHADQG